ncbi:MAG: TonB C-terminal domain-containing protein, partial [Alphaproteobacteria bacterium]|nr:TonB C-terminal domain-containing protein [Alphaproteobacteria bacterium]
HIPEPKKEKQKEPEPKKEPKKDVKKDVKKDPKKDTKKEETKAPPKAEVNLKAKKPKPLASEKKKSVDDIVDSLIDDSLTADEGAEKGAPAMEIGKDITATDIDAIRQKIYKCWLVPIGAQNAKELIVDITMEIAKDGNVTKATIVNKDRMGDPYFQAAAESAQRAVLDPACNPLPLPADKYEKWKKLTLRFNPKDMY